MRGSLVLETRSSRQCLGNRCIDTLPALAHAWSRAVTRQQLTIDWTFTVEKARRVFHSSPGDGSRSQHECRQSESTG
jgi:ABC-type hemin transport system ATPase subunit